MSDHGDEAAARHSRREFLRIGTGMAGAVSLGAMLAACGTQPAQMPADEAVADAGKQAAMALRSYLVIARYNRQKWNTLFPEKSTPLTDVKDMPFARILY